MFWRLLSFGVLTVGLVMLTDTRSQADCDDDDDGCCVRVCRPCPQPSCCAPAPAPDTCVCPYYEMGGFWYAERFEIPTNNCMDGNPIAWQNGPANYCSGDLCGCGIGYLSTSANINCPYLSNCIDPNLSDPPPSGAPCEAGKKTGAATLYLKITSIDGIVLSEPIYVAYWHMVTKAAGKPAVPFWLGWQCTTPSHVPANGVDAVSDPECASVLWVRRGAAGAPGAPNTKRMMVHVTKDGCSP